MNEFAQQIYAILQQTPYGRVVTYGDIAKLAGYPGYARHVGKVLASLPSETQLPWYRVINSQGKISLTAGDAERQKNALTMEGIHFEENRVINFRQLRWII
uniref:MGMT family protein n=1 Tax=Thaumasiovibrio occultus TaxID=1891184 RepID=UPI000B35445A|nr:MGMT family protein [Thaumasiovibrio occultus]